jgi:nitrilase
MRGNKMITKAKSSFARTKTRTAVARTEPQPGVCRVAAIQMASGPSVAANLSEAERLIGMAAAQGAKLVVLPEYFCIMGKKESEKVAVREAEGKGPIQKFLSTMAKKHKIWIVGGSVPLEASVPSKVRNSCLVRPGSRQREIPRRKNHRTGRPGGGRGNSIRPDWSIDML